MIGIIGAGKLGSAIAVRLVKSGKFRAKVIVADRNSGKLAALSDERITATTDVIDAVRRSDAIILCVKPKDVDALLLQAGSLCTGKMVISMAGGISISHLQAGAPGARIIRCMPNLAAGIGMSETGIAFSESVTPEDRKTAEKIFRLLGNSRHIAEEKMAAWTALSGSYPAYVSLCIDAAAEAAQKEGIERRAAVKLAARVTLASAQLLLETGEDPAELVSRVASPGGTTEAGLRVAEEKKLKEGFEEVLAAAIRRAKEVEK